LILNGDILELALANANVAAMAFLRFIELAIPPSGEALFDRIIYIPGNHDHHIWEIDRETQFLNYTMSLPSDAVLPVPYHATSMFTKPNAKRVPETFLMGLLSRYAQLKEKEDLVTVFYPNFGLVNEQKTKFVLFHHGHFIEPIYRLMSMLRTMVFPDRGRPTLPWDIEAENFAWIDFFWSAMGRSGDVGKDIGLVYERLQDEKERKWLLRNLATSAAALSDIPILTERMEASAIERILNYLAGELSGLERLKSDERPLSRAAEEGLWDYVEESLRSQVAQELSNAVPLETTLVFGHTHKPFEADLNFSGYPEWVNTYNTGGWVVDTMRSDNLHGASVVVIDEDLDAAVIRLYRETNTGEPYPVAVHQAMHPGDTPHPLTQLLRGQIQPTEPPWTRFSQVAANAVYTRQQNLKTSAVTSRWGEQD
jgi:hypothetical protein